MPIIAEHHIEHLPDQFTFDREVELPLPYAITLLFTDLPCVIRFRLLVQHGEPDREYRRVCLSICIIAGLFVVYELDIAQNLYPHFPPRYENSTPSPPPTPPLALEQNWSEHTSDTQLSVRGPTIEELL